MPNRSKQKGDRFEREIVEVLRGAGLDAVRVPLSGAQRGFKSDCHVRLKDRILTIEAKSRKGGFLSLYAYLGTNDLLAIKQDRQEPLIVMRLKDAAGLLGVLHGSSVAKRGVEEPAQPQSTDIHPEGVHIQGIPWYEPGEAERAYRFVVSGEKGKG